MGGERMVGFGFFNFVCFWGLMRWCMFMGVYGRVDDEGDE